MNANAKNGTAIEAYLRQQETKGLLRFITCGSVDDGKSTLIGRLLHDTKVLYEDQLAGLVRESKASGSRAGAIDFAYLVDGLQAEREQGITIDVAYRYFSTEKRKFIIADTPGHEQYTRNMATGASTAELAVILIDARYGVQTQTKRHSFLCDLLGIRHFVIAVNKMDLVDYGQTPFDQIRHDFATFAGGLAATDFHFVPLSALEGDNVIGRSANMPWYDGPALLELLETIDCSPAEGPGELRFPVQYVNRASRDFRGYAGTVAAGRLQAGQAVKILPAGTTTTIRSIMTMEGELPAASAGDAVTVTLADEVDVSRGDLIVPADCRLSPSRRIEADLVWMSEQELRPEQRYDLKFGTSLVPAQLVRIENQVDIHSLERTPAGSIGLNGIARCEFALEKPVAVDLYQNSRSTGCFIVIDRLSNETAGAGMVAAAHAERSLTFVHPTAVNRARRAERLRQKPAMLWFTGLSGAGKSTLANALEQYLFALGRHTYLLDGDNLRHGLCRDLGFAPVDREENVRRIGEAARLMLDAGLLVLVSAISPTRACRQAVRELVAPGEFVEIYVETPLAVCEARDPKGLYQRARAGEVREFTGVSARYEPPSAPEIVVDGTQPVEACVRSLVAGLERAGVL